MPLKYFHVLFIAASTLMAVGVGAWAVNAWQASGAAQWLAFAGLSFASAAGLVVYGSRFLKKIRKLGVAWLLVAGTLALPGEAIACPACVGNTDSVLRSGMNMGILALLGVTGFMLVCFAAFFIYLVRRARHVPGASPDFPVRVQEGI